VELFLSHIYDSVLQKLLKEVLNVGPAKE
jgi:hypothetical protein